MAVIDHRTLVLPAIFIAFYHNFNNMINIMCAIYYSISGLIVQQLTRRQAQIHLTELLIFMNS